MRAFIVFSPTGEVTDADSDAYIIMKSGVSSAPTDLNLTRKTPHHIAANGSAET